MKTKKRPASKSAKSSRPRAHKGADTWDAAEVALLFLTKRSPEAAVKLANLLGRTPGAVEVAWRSCDGTASADETQPQVLKQVEKVKEVLGSDHRGKLCFDAPALRPEAVVHTADACCDVEADPASFEKVY